MNWNEGLSALYELKTVDPVSWMDSGSLDFIEGSITKTDSELIESASLKMTEMIGESWVRVYLKAKQTGTGARVAVFTGLATTLNQNIDGWRSEYPVSCFSVLKPAKETLTPRGYYIPAGAPAAQIAAELLSVGPAPVTFEGNAPDLLESIVTEDSDTNLSVAWNVLNAIGWRIRILGDGHIHIVLLQQSLLRGMTQMKTMQLSLKSQTLMIGINAQTVFAWSVVTNMLK